MLKGVNDSPADARELVRLLAGIPAKVNLIPFNPWPGAPYECSSDAAIQAFSDIVFAAGYSAPVRTPRGRDILAACGQLKSASVKLRRSERAAGRRRLIPLLRARLPRLLYVVLGSALAVYGVLVGGLYVFQRQLLYFPVRRPPRARRARGARRPRGGDTTADGLPLLAWYSPPRDGAAGDRVFSRQWRPYRLPRRPSAGVCRGRLRRADGRVSRLWRQPGRAERGRALRRWRRRPRIPEPRGESRRAGWCSTASRSDRASPCTLAAQRDVAALVLEAPFTSVAEVAQYHYPFVPASVLVRDRFDSLVTDREGEGADPDAAWRARQGRAAALRPRAVRCGAGAEGILAVP